MNRNPTLFKTFDSPDVDMLTMAELYQDEFEQPKDWQNSSNGSEWSQKDNATPAFQFGINDNYKYNCEAPGYFSNTNQPGDFGSINMPTEGQTATKLFSSPTFNTDVSNKHPVSLWQKTQSLIKENPAKSLIIAGAVIGGSYLLYKHFEEPNPESSSIRGLSHSKRKKRKSNALNAFLSGLQGKKEERKHSENKEETDDSEETANISEPTSKSSFQEAGLHLASFFGGGVAGTFVGKSAPLAGVGVALYGLYKNNHYLTCAGLGIALSSFFTSAMEDIKAKLGKPQQLTTAQTETTEVKESLPVQHETDEQNKNHSVEGYEQEVQTQVQQPDLFVLDKIEQELAALNNFPANNIDSVSEVGMVTIEDEELNREL